MKSTTTGLPTACAMSSKRRATARRRRFRHQDDHPGARIARQQIQPLERGHRADFGRKIPATGADRLRHPRAEGVDAGGDRLQPGARRPDQSDLATSHPVGESQTRAADDRRATVGSHHQ